MQLATEQHYSRAEYLAMEETTQVRHEFLQGKIFAMSGGTFNHAVLSGNVYFALKTKLREKPCQPLNSDMRIHTPAGLDTYPDVSVYCGQPELTDNNKTLLNPVVIIEVLSPTTRNYDQGEKFRLYRSIPSLQDYLLIDSERIAASHFHKLANADWLLHEHTVSSDIILLPAIEQPLSLAEIYENVPL
ncbi:MAG: Uma2 family endonuclease [Thioploca sp.]|nr:Uma2 family endonuclease [Thioploca sp.]